MTSATEGSDILVDVSSTGSYPDSEGPHVNFSYLVEDVSAIDGVDYTNPAVTWQNASTYDSGDGYQIVIPTTADTVAEVTKSIRIFVRLDDDHSAVFELEADIYDDDATSTNVDVVAQPATEGSDVVLCVSGDVAMDYEYYVEDMSAIAGVDYIDPNYTSSSSWAAVGSGGLITFQTFATTNNTEYQPPQSFKIHVRVAGDPASEVEVEADILDDLADTPYDTVQTVQYEYDPFDKLVKRSFDDDGDGADDLTDSYFSWLGNQMALQFPGDSASDLAHRDLWGPNVDQLLADEAVSSLSSAGSVIYPFADQLGTTEDFTLADGGTAPRLSLITASLIPMGTSPVKPIAV
ncbi:MAG: hypothetical protein QM778_00430 [Myxococcales bacterium]